MLLLLIGFFVLVKCQLEEFQKEFSGLGDVAIEAVSVTSDNGYIVVGSTLDGEDEDGMLLVKFTSNGLVEWIRRDYNGISAHDVVQLSDDTYVVTGAYPEGVFTDVAIAKFTSSGYADWVKRIGSTSGDDVGYGLKATPSDNGFIVTGKTTIPGETYYIVLAKFDSSGTCTWFQGGTGSSANIGYSVDEISGGGYIVGGFHKKGDPITNQAVLLGFDDSGEQIWGFRIDNDDGDDAFTSVSQTSDEGFIAAGFFYINIIDYQSTIMMVVKTDDEGGMLWYKFFGKNFNKEDVVTDIIETSDGSFVFTGYSGSWSSSDTTDVILAKLTADGEISWFTYVPTTSNDKGMSVVEANDGNGYVVAVSSDDGTGLILSKFDNSGENCHTDTIEDAAFEHMILAPVEIEWFQYGQGFSTIPETQNILTLLGWSYDSTCDQTVCPVDCGSYGVCFKHYSQNCTCSGGYTGDLCDVYGDDTDDDDDDTDTDTDQDGEDDASDDDTDDDIDSDGSIGIITESLVVMFLMVFCLFL